MGSESYTESLTSTFSEARVRAVMRKVLADLVGLRDAGLISDARLETWWETLEYLLSWEALAKFQVQIQSHSGKQRALEYAVSDDGTLSENATAGGIDYYGLAPGSISMVLSLRENRRNRDEIDRFLAARGWTWNGTFMVGSGTRDRAYSKDGYGIIRSRIGDW